MTYGKYFTGKENKENFVSKHTTYIRIIIYG